MLRATPTQMIMCTYFAFSVVHSLSLSLSLPLSVKVAYSSDDSVKAVLLKDKTAKAEPGSKPQQYIEVGGVIVELE